MIAGATPGTPPRLQVIDLRNFRSQPPVERLPEEARQAIEVVGSVLPFRTNQYVVDHLIDWDRVPDDPIFRLTFPQRGMLRRDHYDRMAAVLASDTGPKAVAETANAIRRELNPHPAGQMDHNVPLLHDRRLHGIQHKYRETVLFFPQQGQTCHAYCTYCFRWPQFVGLDELKFASRESEHLVAYLRQNPRITDVLFTGGDPMIMKARNLAAYMEPLLAEDLPQIHTIRIGTKSLSYWPYRFLTDRDADDVLRLFERIVAAGKHLAIMAHVTHPNELQTDAVAQAVGRIRASGAQIRTQSPVLRHINDDPRTWAAMWRKQVDLGMVPYYMFVVRDTGAQHYFGLPLVRAWRVFREAYQRVSGICRTVRGPSMSADPGKVQVVGVGKVKGQKVITLRFLQGRDPDWALRPFFAEYDAEASWLDDLRPAFGGEGFFYEEELSRIHAMRASSGQAHTAPDVEPLEVVRLAG